jgi:hypothetical protein
MFSLRDWPTYVFIPLLLLLVLGVPYVAYQRYKSVHRSELIVNAITFSNPDFQLVLELARRNPIQGDWKSFDVEEVSELSDTNLGGFQLVTDTRVLDARAWKTGSSSRQNHIVSYRRMLVRRSDDNVERGIASAQDHGRFRIQQFNPTSDVLVRCSSSELRPLLRKSPCVQPSGESRFMYEAEFDLSSVPAGEDFDIGFELTAPGIQGREARQKRLLFPIIAPTKVATMWVLLPEELPYRDFELISYDQNAPTRVESVEPTYRFEMADGSLFGWMLVAPRDGYMYECRWSLRDN